MKAGFGGGGGSGSFHGDPSPSPSPSRLGAGLVQQGGGLQVSDMADALGHALSEEQLGPQLQVLGVFDEPEAHHGLLPRPQLLLRGTNETQVCLKDALQGE